VERYVTAVFKGMGLAAAGLAAALVVGSAGEARAQGNYGTIKGRLVWGGAEVPKPKVDVPVGGATKDPSVCAKKDAIVSHDLVVDPKTKGVRYAYAYLARPKGTNPAAVQALLKKEPEVVLDQVNCDFVPPITAITEGQTLILKSSDAVNHNVNMQAFTNPAFNQILPPNGQIDRKLKAERRMIPVKCDIHPWMHSYVMVFDHPFFAITKEDGSFEIEGVPPGTQNLVVQLPAVGFVNAGRGTGQPVEVKAGQTTDAGEFKVDPAAAKAALDKKN
jgi:hypothetical protein